MIRQGLVNATLLGWIGLVPVLFLALGPRRGGLIAVFAGRLLLPPGEVLPRIHPAFPLLGTNATGLGLLAGMVLAPRFGRLRGRPGSVPRAPNRVAWPDLLMLGFALAPAMGFAVQRPGPALATDVADTIVYRCLTWLVPYAFARAYLIDHDAPRDVLRAVAAFGLVCLPMVAYESAVGPGRYLLGLIYRIPYDGGMVERMGGWRPEGMLNNGIHLASWMAFAAVAACWLALGLPRRASSIPGWVAAAALVAGCVVCRGMYGLIQLTLGLAALLATRLGRTRAAIVVLALLAPGYVAARVTGVWDGQALVRAAAPTHREGTVAIRIGSESSVLALLGRENFAWGDGTNLWASSKRLQTFWPDGRWVTLFWAGGAMGLALVYAAVHLAPIALALRVPRGRPTWYEAGSPTWGLALLSALHMVDGIHNGFDLSPVALIGGTIVAARLPATARPPEAAPEHWALRLARLAAAAAVLALPELASWLLGRAGG